jgi:threonyl-tRNA synthetase
VQIESEVAGVLDMLKHVYDIFGFDYTLALSTRPEKDYLGDVKTWDSAEQQLQSCLDKFCKSVNKVPGLNKGDGAFYGPKIDIQLFDALKRKHQCATIQLDFQLPERFQLYVRLSCQTDVLSADRCPLSDLCSCRIAALVVVLALFSRATRCVQFKASDGTYPRPVMIHRAILGSVERMLAVLMEHTGGKWPFWLSPRQACVVPVSPVFTEYATKVYDEIKAAGFHADIDDSKKQLNNKIREAFLEQWNYIVVVGEKARH